MFSKTIIEKPVPKDEKCDVVFFPVSEYKKDHWALQYPKSTDENFIAILKINEVQMNVKLNPSDARGYRSIVTIVNEDMASTLNRAYSGVEKRALQTTLSLVVEAYEAAGCRIAQQQIAGNNSQSLTKEGLIQIGNAKEPNMLHGHIIARGNPQKAYIGNVILNGPEPSLMFNMRGDGAEEGNKTKLRWKADEMNVVATILLTKIQQLLPSYANVNIIAARQPKLENKIALPKLK